MRHPLSRRDTLRLLGASAAAVAASSALRGASASGPGSSDRSASPPASSPLLERPIPSSNERLPAVGLGTWQTFDVADSPEQRQPLQEVLSEFARRGGRLVDSSPMYGRSEAVAGDLARRARLDQTLFFATKVWTSGRDAGIAQLEQSRRLLRGRLDLEQVHNLLDVSTQLPMLREARARGEVRYVGVSHYTPGAYREVEKVLAREPLDFLQINYSIFEREAEERLLPLAADRGVAVIANRPFAGGEGFRRVRGKALPDWAAEIDCRSWGAFFIKWILGNPAVTAAIPATDKVRHLGDNMDGGVGRLPDAAMRRRMARLVG